MLRALHLENFRIVANHALRIERELVPCPVRILARVGCMHIICIRWESMLSMHTGC